MTNTSLKDTDDIKDLIQVLNSGVKFYRDAKQDVKDSTLITVFNDVIVSHEKCAQKLQPLVIAEDGKAETGSSWSVGLRELYTKATANMRSDKDLGYISQLEEVEDKLLAKCNEAIESNHFTLHQDILRQVRSELSGCHNRIRQLQKLRESMAS